MWGMMAGPVPIEINEIWEHKKLGSQVKILELSIDGNGENLYRLQEVKTGANLGWTTDSTLRRLYSKWVDPYAAAKAIAKRDGWVWKDAPEEPTPSFDKTKSRE